ncbi:MAG: hypothetical protein GX141_07105 [Armatimonadetes bacterium]|nr:hypothetical protein [Armatimonadota bacterium]
MRLFRTLSTSTLIVLSLALVSPIISGQSLGKIQIEGIPRIKQLHNYCGPATMTSVMQYMGERITQQEIGKEIYDPVGGATHGAEMLLFARNKGYAAYSWNSNINDAKHKLAAGSPLLVLQQNSDKDNSGHFRVLTGYDDETSKFYVTDPYYDDITELSYSQCEKLWKPMGYWALIVVSAEKDTFSQELSDKNPVVHMDLSYALYKHGQYSEALKEIRTALSLEPSNSYARAMLNKINGAIGAGKKGKP